MLNTSNSYLSIIIIIRFGARGLNMWKEKDYFTNVDMLICCLAYNCTVVHSVQLYTF